MSSPSSPFLRRLRSAVIDGLEPDIDLACKVAVLNAAGHGKAEIARRVGATGATYRRAEGLAKHAAVLLDHGD